MLYIIRDRIHISLPPLFLRWNIILFYMFSKELFLIFLVIFFYIFYSRGPKPLQSNAWRYEVELYVIIYVICNNICICNICNNICNNNRTRVHNKCYVLELFQNQPPQWSMEKLSSMKWILGARKFGNCWFEAYWNNWIHWPKSNIA